MKSGLGLIYAAIAYLLGAASLLYLAGFLIDFGVPKGINDGPLRTPWLAALIDSLLIGLYGLHHSATARSAFKRWWTQWVGEPVERATYLYMTCATTALLIYFWQPIPITLWRVESLAGVSVLVAAYGATWLMLLAATFHFGHFEFMGLRQAWEHYRNRARQPTPFSARCLYALVRHPISLGWMLMPWLTPHMTVGQLVWALSITVYIVIATRYEEADLVHQIGDRYVQYQKETPRFVPGSRA